MAGSRSRRARAVRNTPFKCRPAACHVPNAWPPPVTGTAQALSRCEGNPLCDFPLIPAVCGVCGVAVCSSANAEPARQETERQSDRATGRQRQRQREKDGATGSGSSRQSVSLSTGTQFAVPTLAYCSISGQQLTRWEVACSVGTWRRAVAVVVGRSQEKRKYRACSFGAGLGATRTATQLTRSVDRGVRER